MNYLTSKTPDECLRAAEVFFRFHWPYKGLVQKTDTLTIFTEEQGILGVIFKGSPRAARVFALSHENGAEIRVSTDRTEYAAALEPLLRELDAR